MSFFKGLYTALVTPFTKDGALDVPALERLIQAQLEAKVSGIVFLGTTAESPTLNHAEKCTIIETGVRLAKGRCQIVAGTGTNSTADSVAFTREAAHMGVDAVMAVTPYYNKPGPEGQYQHFVAIAEAAGLPTLIYNIKSRTGINTDIATMLRLSEHLLIQGVKEASGDLDQIMQLRARAHPDFSILAGDDAWALPVIALGGVGLVSVISNLRPQLMNDIVNLACTNKGIEARAAHYALLPLIQSMFIEANPQPVKTALALEGIIEEAFRLPLTTMQADTRAKLAVCLAHYAPAAQKAAAA